MNNNDSQHPIDPRRRRAARLLSRGWTQKRVAEELEISEQTLCKWRREPLVEALIVNFSIEREQKEMEKFSILMNSAYSRLAKIVESDDDKVALAAIKIVIDAKDQLLSTTVAPNHDAPKIAPTVESKPGADPRSKELSSSPADDPVKSTSRLSGQGREMQSPSPIKPTAPGSDRRLTNLTSFQDVPAKSTLISNPRQDHVPPAKSTADSGTGGQESPRATSPPLTPAANAQKGSLSPSAHAISPESSASTPPDTPAAKDPFSI